MAKSKKSNRPQRDANVIATRPRVLAVVRSPVVSLPRPVLPVLAIEDRRQWHPAPFRPAQALQRPAARVVARQKPNQWQPSQTKAILAFADPDKVAICARRSRRRQVLFAFKRTAKGAGSKRRRNEFSNVSCRR